jgi:hypothetical protein
MCEWALDDVVIDPGTPERHGRDGVWCDPCIAPLVKALRDAGIRSVASCCGHGRNVGSIVLDDGRELVIRQFVPPAVDGHQRPISWPAAQYAGISHYGGTDHMTVLVCQSPSTQRSAAPTSTTHSATIRFDGRRLDLSYLFTDPFECLIWYQHGVGSASPSRHDHPGRRDASPTPSARANFSPCNRHAATGLGAML